MSRWCVADDRGWRRLFYSTDANTRRKRNLRAAISRYGFGVITMVGDSPVSAANTRRFVGVMRPLPLAAHRFVVLKIKRKGRTRIVGERHVMQCLAHADALDAVLANLKRAVDLLRKHAGVTREQAIEMLTPWARDDDGVSFEDRILLALVEDASWEPHKGRRLEVIERATGRSGPTLDRRLRRAKARRRTVQTS